MARAHLLQGAHVVGRQSDRSGAVRALGGALGHRLGIDEHSAASNGQRALVEIQVGPAEAENLGAAQPSHAEKPAGGEPLVLRGSDECRPLRLRMGRLLLEGDLEP